MYLEPLYIALGLAIVSLSFALYRQELGELGVNSGTRPEYLKGGVGGVSKTSERRRRNKMTQMIWQAEHHEHTGETTPPGKDMVPNVGEPIAARAQSDLDRLLSAVQGHEVSETEAIAAYRSLAREATDPVVRGLFHMLAQDEEHHHRVLSVIGMELRTLATAGIRPLDMPPRPTEPAVREQLRELASMEREGTKELRLLADQAPTLLRGLVSLLLQLIALDSEKHELILRYVIKELESAGAQ